MGIDGQGGISIVNLIVYIPASVLAHVLCFRHGLAKSSAWIYVAVLCVVRIAGAVCQLMTYSNDSVGLLKAVLILDSIGLSPLLLATLGLLSRFVGDINSRGGAILRFHQTHLIQVLVTVGLILGIVGGTSGSSTTDDEMPAASKAGVILSIAAFAAMIPVLFVASRHKDLVTKGERLVPLAVLLAMPLILVRLVYSALAVFNPDSDFSATKGSVGVKAGMATVEEILVVVDYLALGLALWNAQTGVEKGLPLLSVEDVGAHRMAFHERGSDYELNSAWTVVVGIELIMGAVL